MDMRTYLKVEKLSTEVAELQTIMAKMLAVQERQEAALKTIAGCLEKITGAMTMHYPPYGSSPQPSLSVVVANSADCR